MTTKMKIAYSIIAVLVIDRIAVTHHNIKLAKQVKIDQVKIDTYFGGMEVMSRYIPAERYAEVLHALEVDPILNYHSS